MFNLKDKYIIVTGSSQGIGKTIVEELASLGANVILLSRNETKLISLVNKLENKYSQNFKHYKLDVSIEDDVNEIFKKILTKFDKIDTLINNAGITSDNIIVRMNSTQWNDVINTNLNGSFYCCKAISKKMIKQNFGNIINISSIIGLTGNKGQCNYAASKAGIIGLTKSLAKELAPKNITVNNINPGYIKTEMTDSLNSNNKDIFLDKIPLKRFGSTKDIANIAAFLCSDMSNYITGQNINIDGGITI